MKQILPTFQTFLFFIVWITFVIIPNYFPNPFLNLLLLGLSQSSIRTAHDEILPSYDSLYQLSSGFSKFYYVDYCCVVILEYFVFCIVFFFNFCLHLTNWWYFRLFHFWFEWLSEIASRCFCKVYQNLLYHIPLVIFFY